MKKFNIAYKQRMVLRMEFWDQDPNLEKVKKSAPTDIWTVTKVISGDTGPHAKISILWDKFPIFSVSLYGDQAEAIGVLIEKLIDIQSVESITSIGEK